MLAGMFSVIRAGATEFGSGLPFGQKNRRISGIVFDVEIIGPLLSDSTIARTRNGRPEY